MHNESGDIGTRMISRTEVRAMVRGLGDEVTGASYCPIDGHANPLHLLRALHARSPAPIGQTAKWTASTPRRTVSPFTSGAENTPRPGW